VVELRLSELCKTLTARGFPAELEGEDLSIRAVNTLEDAKPGELSFLSNPRYTRLLPQTRASAVIVAPDVDVPPKLTVIRCPQPYAGITVAIVRIHGHRTHPQWGISDRASIEPSARLGENANIAPGATIAAQVEFGAGATIYPGCYVGERVRIGDDVVLYPNVVVYEDCILGDRVAVHAGSVIGQDGLGYAPVDDKWLKIPQVGRVIIGDDVEIGSLCAIDRATLGDTRIESGTKFSNLIAIGHGSKIGENCMFVAQVGVAGSVTVGRHVTLAGQVGVAGHLTIGDKATVAGQSGVFGDVEPEAKMLGTPAADIGDAKRQLVAAKKLPKWSKAVNERIDRLERELAALKADADRY